VIFADSSALVKRYVPEVGHEIVDRLPRPFLVSLLATVDVPAALWRKHRMGEIGASDAALLTQAFEDDIAAEVGSPSRLEVVALTPAIIESARHLVAVHPLRAYDAVQLATALAVREAVGRQITFVSFDHNLSAAAATEGLTSR